MSFWLSFWLTNIHFAIELFAAMSSFVLVYVFFETWRAEKQAKLLIRLMGFVVLGIFYFTQSTSSVSGFSLPAWQLIIKLLGFLLIGISFFIDPVQRVPKAPAGDKKPKNSSVSDKNSDKKASGIFTYSLPFIGQVSLQVVTLIILAATLLRAYIKQIKGLEKELKKLTVGLLFLFLSELVASLGLFAETDYILLSKLSADFGPLWIIQNIFIFIAFFFIGLYAWGYLRFRLVSQIIGAFIASGLAIFITVTFVYTSLLVKAMEKSSLENLQVNLRTLNYAIDSLKDETLATTSLVASNQTIKDALVEQEPQQLFDIAQEQLISSGEDFLAIIDESGNVLARGEEKEAVHESLSSNAVVTEALAGRGAVNMTTRDWVNAPQVVIETAVPVATSGAVYTGRIIDNAFVDGLKQATGLEVTVFADKIRSATTLVSSDSVSRLVGVQETNETINSQVLEKGEFYLGLSKVSQREYLSSYGPFKNSKGEILGMLFVGYPSVVLFEAARTSLNITFYVTAILAVLSFIPAYLLAKFIEKHQV